MLSNFERECTYDEVRTKVKPVELKDDFTISFDELRYVMNRKASF